MSAIGTTLGARDGTATLFSWPPSEEAANRHGILGLATVAASCFAVVSYTLRAKEESHTPPVLKVKSRADVRRRKSWSEEISPVATPVVKTKESKEDEDAEWRESEMEVRRPKLVQLTLLAQESIDKEDKTCPVRFKELLEACVEVRTVDHRCPDLPKGFCIAAKILIKELAEATKLTLAGTSARHKTGEDVADLIGRYSTLHAMCRGLAGDKVERKAMWAEMSSLWWKSWYSQLMLWRMRIPDVLKAFKIVFLAKRYVPLLVISSGLKVAANAVDALDTLFKAETLELLRHTGFTRVDLWKKMKAAVILASIKTCFTMMGDRLNTLALVRLHHRLRTEVYSSMLRQDLEWYRLGQQDQRDVHGLFGEIFALPDLSGTFINALLRTVETFSSLLFTGSLIQQRSSGFVFILVSSKFLMNCGRTLIDIGSGVATAIVTRTLSKMENNWIEPLMPENISTVRACAAEAKVLQNWNMFFRSEHERHSLADLVGSAGRPAHWVVNSMGSWVEMGTAAKLVLEGKIPYVADVQSVFELSKNTGTTLYEAAWAVMRIREAIPKLARTYELIYTEPSIGLEGGLVPDYPHAEGKLEFKDVSFEYPGTGKVLQDVSFEIPVQGTCGVTGSSGAGKSTILLLIQRLYDPLEGQILLDGVDIKTLNPLWVRRQIGVVSQRPRIFHTTLLKNLTYGCELDPTDEEVEVACKAAHLHDLIFKNPFRFPLGIHTRVSNETLSGGELQRVAIARALLKDAPILILDEATSALDSESQSEVKEGIKTLMKGRTVICVAHRLETIKDSDAILCIEEGRVRERGSHQELVQAGGLYSRLYKEQIESTISNTGFGFDGAELDTTDALESAKEAVEKPAATTSTD